MKINIMGTEYELTYFKDEVPEDLKPLYGECRFWDKEIRINSQKHDTECSIQDTVRHEIMHAMFFECGLVGYGNDETLVEWIASQLPKIVKVAKEANVI